VVLNPHLLIALPAALRLPLDHLLLIASKILLSSTDTIGKPRMQFHGRHSWIRCFAHVIALICTDILSFMKSGTAKEAKKLLDSWDKEYKCNTYYIPLDSSRSSIAKVRLFNLWLLRRPEREQ
jgi:hypothetical protein